MTSLKFLFTLLLVGSFVFRRSEINKKQSLNLGGMICLAATVYFIYYLLVKDKMLPSCVTSVLSLSARHWHLLGVALIPICIALMIFGAGMMSLYIGSALQRWLGHFWKE